MKKKIVTFCMLVVVSVSLSSCFYHERGHGGYGHSHHEHHHGHDEHHHRD